MKKLIIFFLIVSCIYTETIVLGSFNTLHLGWDGKNYKETAKILSLFDIVSLQEVMNKEGIVELISNLEDITKEKWAYHLSPYPVGNGEKYNEFYGFIYKKNKISFIKSYGFFKELNNEFIREPYGAMFKSKNFDFILVSCHLVFGDSKKDRQSEAENLNKVYDYFQNLDINEQDIIITGDFNLPAYDESFKGLLKHKDSIFYAIDPVYKTTIGKSSLSNSYDNIFYSYKYTKEYTGNNGVYNYTEDYIKEYGQNVYKILRKTISDHLPVYIELLTDKDDD